VSEHVWLSAVGWVEAEPGAPSAADSPVGRVAVTTAAVLWQVDLPLLPFGIDHSNCTNAPRGPSRIWAVNFFPAARVAHATFLHRGAYLGLTTVGVGDENSAGCQHVAALP
jgi:hypothetical protein